MLNHIAKKAARILAFCPQHFKSLNIHIAWHNFPCQNVNMLYRVLDTTLKMKIIRKFEFPK